MCLCERMCVCVGSQLTDHLLEGSDSVRNNASWALGEIAMHLGKPTVEHYTQRICEQLTVLLKRGNGSKILMQNACITLGRFGLVHPEGGAHLLGQYLEAWCDLMASSRTDSEKVIAFQGLCRLVDRNRLAVRDHIPRLLVAVASFNPTRIEAVQQPPTAMTMTPSSSSCVPNAPPTHGGAIS
eukprot:GHVU01061074.1.p1 GENE.GHVU01061074.1~~GHVU01061074.1.p1  ORF type:complete len:183 (-),score=38.03 GHVU01061074.1:438-986(-)